jgi:hypothetical protein
MTRSSVREVAAPPKTAALLRDWLETALEDSPDAFVFAAESGKPVCRDTLPYDHIRTKLKPLA